MEFEVSLWWSREISTNTGKKNLISRFRKYEMETNPLSFILRQVGNSKCLDLSQKFLVFGVCESVDSSCTEDLFGF